ncbi:hypothetical protein KA517_04840 [Candidatus Gracilibacteria bacterium]|jgi:hypothetical protein|nr:hypothetical protein [Candidatus Gracilibacteria bacterium]
MELHLGDLLPPQTNDKKCPECGELMNLRTNVATFWEKNKEKQAFFCTNSNCLHKIELTVEDLNLLVLEKNLTEWELSLDSLDADILERHQLQDLIRAMRKTLHHTRKGADDGINPKQYFLGQLKKQHKPTSIAGHILGTAVPLLALAITLTVLVLLGPKIGELLKASVLTLYH